RPQQPAVAVEHEAGIGEVLAERRGTEGHDEGSGGNKSCEDCDRSHDEDAPQSPNSPRLRGEADARSASGEGGSASAQPVENPPPSDPLPASGDRERAVLA